MDVGTTDVVCSSADVGQTLRHVRPDVGRPDIMYRQSDMSAARTYFATIVPTF